MGRRATLYPRRGCGLFGLLRVAGREWRHVARTQIARHPSRACWPSLLPLRGFRVALVRLNIAARNPSPFPLYRAQFGGIPNLLTLRLLLLPLHCRGFLRGKGFGDARSTFPQCPLQSCGDVGSGSSASSRILDLAA